MSILEDSCNKLSYGSGFQSMGRDPSWVVNGRKMHRA